MHDQQVKIVITHKHSERFAAVHWTDSKGQTKISNICDACDGNIKVPAAVRKFAQAWVDA